MSDTPNQEPVPEPEAPAPEPTPFVEPEIEPDPEPSEDDAVVGSGEPVGVEPHNSTVDEGVPHGEYPETGTFGYAPAEG